MKPFTILAGTSLLLACAAGASAQDNQPAPRPAPRLMLRHAPQGGVLQVGPRMREAGPRLGVNVEATPDGLKVTGVDDGSLAASAGIKEGDVLMRIGDERVHEVDDVALALHGQQAGAKIAITVIRPGEGLVTLAGTLPEVKEKEQPKVAAADGMKGGFLGVQMKENSDCGGVGVAGVVPDSAAWFAGLDEGDCLLSIDGKALASAEDLAGAVAAKEPGSLVELRFRRNGEEQTTKVRLGHRGPFGMLGSLNQPGALGPGVFKLSMPQMDDDAEPFSYDLDMPDVFQFKGGQFDMPGMDELKHMLDGLQSGDLDGAHSVEVRIDDDHMSVTHDGATETYQRDADGNWIKQDAGAAAPQKSHGA